MKNSKTPKIVVGVGLAAIYAAAMAAFIPRDGHNNVAAQNTSAAPAAQVAPELAPPPAIPSADTSTIAAEQSAVTAAAAAPVASVTAKTLEAPPARREVEAKSQVKEQPVASVASASPKSEGGFEEPSTAIKGNSAGDNTVITEDVKAQTAAVAADATSAVITDSPAVELARSESTQE